MSQRFLFPGLDKASGPSGTPALDTGAAAGHLNVGSAATVDDLPDGSDLTLEGWFYFNANTGAIYSKGENSLGGYLITLGGSATRINVQMDFLTTDISDRVDSASGHTGAWHHYAFVWDDTAKIWTMFIDGVQEDTTIDVPVGAYQSDAALSLRIGAKYNGVLDMTGYIGWQRISSIKRYTAGFTPDARDAPPANDANTVRLFKVDEGSGTTITDYSSNATDATAVSCTWVSV